MVVIDADGAVVGRLGARVAKLLLSGTTVEIINSDKARMMGSLVAAKEKYMSRRHQQNKRNPDESPKWPRVSHLLLRRMIRGMLPHKSQRGRDAYKKLHVVMGASSETGKAIKIQEASGASKHGGYTLAELCREIGGRY